MRFTSAGVLMPRPIRSASIALPMLGMSVRRLASAAQVALVTGDSFGFSWRRSRRRAGPGGVGREAGDTVDKRLIHPQRSDTAVRVTALAAGEQLGELH